MMPVEGEERPMKVLCDRQLESIDEEDGHNEGAGREGAEPEEKSALDRHMETLEQLQLELASLGADDSILTVSSPEKGAGGAEGGVVGEEEEEEKTNGFSAEAGGGLSVGPSTSSDLDATRGGGETLHGGAACSELIVVDLIRSPDLYGILQPSDVLLSVEDVPVSGMLYSEVTRVLHSLFHERDQIAVEVLPGGSIPVDLRELLADRRWAELQGVIRDNIYARTVPYTTRAPRAGEIDGEHYRFVEVEEFEELQRRGLLLEHGSFQGHLYGTPRPLEPLVREMVAGSVARGPLPANWEIAYSEDGEKYFIDHNRGVTTWNDPRELPSGWEQVDDPLYGTFFVDHVNKRTQYERPVGEPNGAVTTVGGGGAGGVGGAEYGTVVKPPRQHLHHSFHNNNNNNNNGVEASPPMGYAPPQPARGAAGGYVFTRDPNQLRGEIIQTIIVKGEKGLGFTLIGNDASSKGDEFIQVKSVIADGPAAMNGVLQPGDVLVSVNGEMMLGSSQSDACRAFVSIQSGQPAHIQVCRGYPLMLDPSNRIITESVYASQRRGASRQTDQHDIDICKGAEGFGFTIADHVSGQRVKKVLYPAQCPNLLEGDTIVQLDGENVRALPHTELVDRLRDLPVGHRGRLVVSRAAAKHRSRTPSAAFRYGEGGGRGSAATLPAQRSKTPGGGGRTPMSEAAGGAGTMRMRPSSTTLGFATPNYMPLSSLQGLPASSSGSQLITVNLIRKPSGFGFRLLGGLETGTPLSVGQLVAGGAAADDGRLREGDEIIHIDGKSVEGASHSEAVSLLERAAHHKHVKLLVCRRGAQDVSRSLSMPSHDVPSGLSGVCTEYDVVLHRSEGDGFGFIIISSVNRNGSTIGQILDGTPAARCGRLSVGDRVVAVDGNDITHMPHGEIVALIKSAGLSVRLTIAPPLSAASGGGAGGGGGENGMNGTMQSTHVHGSYATYSQAPSAVSYPPPPPSAIRDRDNYDYAERAVDEPPGERIDVELHRGARGFGFSIRGGHEFGAMPLFVLRIAEEGAAAADGRLRVGDRVVSINGTDTRGLTHEHAIQLIKQHPTVNLVLLRHALP